jgi:cell wall assembly regulator SMI1
MNVVQELANLKQAKLQDEDGAALTATFLPGCDETRIAAIEREIGAALPADLRELLRHTSGIDGLLDQITFDGKGDFGMEDTFPHCLPIAHDGFGNFWVVDARSTPEEKAQVYFACHDAPVILYQCDGMAIFLAELRRMHTAPHQSLLDDVHEDRPCNVWRSNPGTITQADALQSTDELIRSFAETLDDRFLLVDLRAPQPGMGFSWGRFGPRTEVRRHGEHRLFAYAKPATKPGLLSRLFKGS